MYNPFNKNISEIEYEDLKKLTENDVSEGWVMEYKGSFPKNKKIANSIASFANSLGGWYIIGIEENENESKPSEIIGFDLEDNKKPTDKITNIIKDNIDPIPYFETKLVEIPKNKFVLVVQVFEGHDAPYISNGSIYLRIGETSKLLAIDNRYQFDKLIDKKQSFQKNINSFMDNTFFFDEYYTQPYLEFYVYLNNPEEVLFEDFYSEEFFENLKENFNSNVKLTDELELSASINFDNVYGSVDSYILRHVYDNDPMQTGLTLELFKEGHLKLIFPFNVYDNLSLNREYESLIYYDSFVSEYGDLKIIDLAESIFAFQTILTQYKRLLEKFNCNHELIFKYKFNNFDSITPFMNSDEYMGFINENKLPINLKTSINIPNRGYSKCQFKDFNPLTFAIKIIEATGLPRHLIDVISEGYATYINIRSNK
ncbi:helix-turn-helix domain-containing protein [Methanobrevibacter sp. UBA212]|uniref:AlbA family DNA-binding domain-containing protein n=1 Tax=Methanobrevibacter sp. UBA212 TaxID=1915476 RepID=UPI0025DE4664|nr:ATP-binding protein [Methanobrevibacter sp. UBA212]